ncbi:adenosine monophosphate-protein transferase Fic-like [Ctenocephalides felis]|uniref:adenosine monophosphate-protein transferase Fic-like n=1 Tax=Ctenocephalides felis TaxID=7515 RepID=UPI000E6E111E|nr:adenosine monophosphate-protein transferase Fic-like [Ctenocephalides felis]
MVKGHSLIIVSLVIGLVAIIYTCYNKTKKSNYELAYSYFPQGYYLGAGEESYALINQYSIDNEEANKVSEIEALSSLKAAMDLKVQGRLDRALKLFEHAAALAPKHPDVLTKYGEFLEETKKDIVKADQLYFQALTYCPTHTDAVSNRQRTSTIVANIDNTRLESIDRKRDALAAIPESNGSLRRAKKEAYFSYIYHTVAIEGNTMTLQQTRSVLETRMAVMGKSIDEHNEILGLDSAMKYINSSILNRMGEITINDILEIHRRVLGHVDPVEGGSMRRTQVYVGGHVPPSPSDLTVLMSRFERWLNSQRESESVHPVRLAALAHYKLVHIHPFTDGNGRTSRLLMNVILMQAGYPPVIILKQHRHLYYETLRIANEGDVRPFVRFIAECTENTLDLFLWATSEFSNKIPALAQEFSSTTDSLELHEGSADFYEETNGNS